MKTFLLALQFLTIIPLRLKSEIKAEDYRSIFLYFPLIGAVIGFLLCLLAWLLRGLPHLAVAALVLAFYTVITGALHVDGFADSCDGLLAGKTKQRRLEIMQDSHIGAYAAVGVSLLLILKFAFLASLTEMAFLKILFLMPMFSRWVQGLVCATSKYARAEGKSNFFFQAASQRDVWLGAVFCLILFFLLMRLKGLILFSMAVLPVGLWAKFVHGKIDGMTGDTIGAASEIAELGILFFSLILMA